MTATVKGERIVATPRAELASEVAQSADFSAVRYSQAWEDPACLRRALDITDNDSVLSIAAAGDNSFALLLYGAGRVVSVDMNPAQCALVELKRAAIMELDHDELLRFVGVTPAHDRATLYTRLRQQLPADARAYWDANPDLVVKGVIHAGRLEAFFAMFRRFVLPVTHTRRTLEGMFEPRERLAREAYYEQRFNNRRWQALMRVFFSQAMIGRFGRDPAFFEHVNLPSVSGHYAARARHAMVEQPVSGNWFVQYILLGRYLDVHCTHPYLRPENHELLRERMDRLEVHCAELEKFLGEQPASTFTKFNLSDIFEWMSDELYEQMLRALVRTSAKGGRLAYWNNLVPRSRPASLADVLEPQRELAREIHDDDRAFLYRDFHVEQIVAMPDDEAGS